jgi:hypothetical protein
MNKAWTMKEIQFLQDNKDKFSVNEIAEYLNRSFRSVKSQAERLGIKLMSQSHKNFYVQTYYMYDKNETPIAFGTIEEIANKLGKKFNSIKSYTYNSSKNNTKLKSYLVPAGDSIFD